MLLSDYFFFTTNRREKTRTHAKIKKNKKKYFYIEFKQKVFSIFVIFFLILGNNRKCQEF